MDGAHRSNETDKSHHQKLENKAKQMQSNLSTTATLGKDERGLYREVVRSLWEGKGVT